MKVHLLYPDSKVDREEPVKKYMEELEKDLELEGLYQLMANDDDNIKSAVRHVLLHPLTDRKVIAERQNIIKDCISNEVSILNLYQLLKEVMKSKQDMNWLYATSPSGTLGNAVGKLKKYYSFLERLAGYAKSEKENFKSKGFSDLFEMLTDQIDREFLDDAKKLLEELEFKNGMLLKMKLGKDNRCIGYQPVFDENIKQHLKWRFTPSYTLGSTDMAGVRDFCDRKDKAAENCVEIIEHAADSVERFFEELYWDTGFFVGILNLREQLVNKEMEYCFPDMDNSDYREFENLREVNLLFEKSKCVGNDLQVKGKKVYIITGANRGGKTVYLKSMGQAQIMAQSGMFVLAKSFHTHVANGIFTHFKREEDSKLKSGKLDEELNRLDQIIPCIKPGALLLYNESFASTNEREGSEICYQITRALMESGVEQMHVTHLYAFSDRVYEENWEEAYFLRAVRKDNGERTYRIEEGRPQQSAFGKDLYLKIWES